MSCEDQTISCRLPSGSCSVLYLQSRYQQKYVPPYPTFIGILIHQPVDDPISAYRHWKGFNASESNFRRLWRYYAARAEDRSKFIFRFRQGGMVIHIFIHRRVPLREFLRLIQEFIKAQDEVKVFQNENENIEIRIVDPGEEGQVLDLHARDRHPDYKTFYPNETNFKRICRFYDARAEDRCWIEFSFRPTRMSAFIIVHKRVPLQEFKLLLEKFYLRRLETDLIVSNENVEIRQFWLPNLRQYYQDTPGDWTIGHSEDPDDEVVNLDGRPGI